MQHKTLAVVFTHNEEMVIEQKIANIRNFDVDILVVDSASIDRTVEICNKHNVEVVKEEERKGKAFSINNLYSTYEGLWGEYDFLVFTDADCIWKEEIVENALASFIDSSVGVVTGRQIQLGGNNKHKLYRFFYYILRKMESWLCSTPIMHGEFLMMRRKVFYPPRFDSVADDTEMAFNAIRRGWKVKYNEKCCFYEGVPIGKDLIRQKKRRGFGLAQVFWRNKDMLLNFKYGLFGLVVFPFEFLLHSPLFLLLHENPMCKWDKIESTREILKGGN